MPCSLHHQSHLQCNCTQDCSPGPQASPFLRDSEKLQVVAPEPQCSNCIAMQLLPYEFHCFLFNYSSVCGSDCQQAFKQQGSLTRGRPACPLHAVPCASCIGQTHFQELIFQSRLPAVAC